MRSRPLPFDVQAIENVEGFSDKSFAVHAARRQDVVEMEIMGEIGMDDVAGGVTAKGVRQFLRANQDAAVNVAVNSNGGLVFDGLAIYNAFLEHPQPVRATVMGLAFSAASVAILGADEVKIYENAQIGIHRAWALAIGNAEEMRGTAEMLESIDASLVGIYTARTGASSSQVARWMKGTSDGTLFAGADAVANGFADEMISNRGASDTAAAAKQTSQPRLGALAAKMRIAALKRLTTA